ncbi:MAG: S-layer homology domain-containing protein [Cyanobacteria bacterium J06638_28]
MVIGRAKVAVVSVVALSLLTGCVGSPFGDVVERSLEADPQLEEGSNLDSASTTDETETPDEVADSRSETEAGDTTPRPSETNTNAESNRAPLTPPQYPSRTTTPTPTTASRFSEPDLNLEGVPAELHPYLEDLQALQVIDVATSQTEATDDANTSAAPSPFTQTVTRREYARWLFQVHNALYADQPGDRLRAAATGDEPAFQDVPTTDPAFSEIQGLVEAGIIPSTLTGSSTAVNFRPDAPLTRESAVLWKVPLDIRAALPNTTPQAVSETWGFQDIGKIEPLALRAVAADFQLGDFSNIRRAFGYTTLFRPAKAVSRAEAMAMLWRFGNQTEGRAASEAVATERTERTETVPQ